MHSADLASIKFPIHYSYVRSDLNSHRAWVVGKVNGCNFILRESHDLNYIVVVFSLLLQAYIYTN